MVDFRINGTRQTGAVGNRTYRGGLNAVRLGNRTYRGAKVSVYFFEFTIVAVQFLDLVESYRGTGGLTVAAIDSTLFQKAERLFRQYNTARLSFTDCTSFVVCQQYNISEAFAFDQHFPMMGITLRR